MTSQAEMAGAFFAPTIVPVRQYMRRAFAGALARYDRLVIPLCGMLQMAEQAVDAGWRAAEIQCTDTNLFSAVLGTMAAGSDLAELQIEFGGDTPEAEWARAKLASGNVMAAVGLTLKLHSLNRQSVTMERLVRAELWAQRDRYGNQLQAGAQRLAEKLQGLDFQVGDVFAKVTEVAADELAMLYVEPPRMLGRPFACVGEPGAPISWKAPVIAPFEARTGLDKLHHDLMPANALAFLRWPGMIMRPNRQERVVFAHDRGEFSREYVLCNRPNEALTLVKSRKETEIAAAPYPVCTSDSIVSSDSIVTVHPTSKAIALYYCDLWGRSPKGRLGTPFLVMLDGALLGVAGMNFSDIRKSMGKSVSLVSLATVPGFARADVLAMLALTCEDARKLFQGVADAPLYDVGEFKRAFLDYADMLNWPCAAAGLELIHRVRQDNGRYQLAYQGAFRGALYLELAREFLALPTDGESSLRTTAKSYADFPLIILQHGPSSPFRLTAHKDFQSAKAGDMLAAERVIADALREDAVARVRTLIGRTDAWIVPVRRTNTLPVAYANVLGRMLNVQVDQGLINVNAAGRSGQDAVYRLCKRAQFSGPVQVGQAYVMVDDMVTQGGTLAELRSYILQRGGKVLGASALAGAKFSHILAPRPEILEYARNKFAGLDDWFALTFGYPLECMTDSEAYSLGRFASFEALTARLAELGEARGENRVPWHVESVIMPV